MKRLLFSICYWAVALPVLSLILLSLGYSFAQALLLSTTILPSVLAVKWLGRDIDWRKRGERALKVLLLVALALAINYLCLFVVLHGYFGLLRAGGILENPVFLLMVTFFFAGVNILVENAICVQKVKRDRYIEFISDRRPVKLELDSIKFVESNDDEVWVHTLDGQSFRTKMTISAWEGALDDRFLRVHRSFIVNRALVTSRGVGHLMLGEDRIDVSRKYRDVVERELKK